MTSPNDSPAPSSDTSTVGTSPKTWAAGWAGLVLGAIVSVLNGVQADPSLVGSLPVWAQSLIIVVVTTLGAGGAAYAAGPGTVTKTTEGPGGQVFTLTSKRDEDSGWSVER